MAVNEDHMITTGGMYRDNNVSVNNCHNRTMKKNVIASDRGMSVNEYLAQSSWSDYACKTLYWGDTPDS